MHRERVLAACLETAELDLESARQLERDLKEEVEFHRRQPKQGQIEDHTANHELRRLSAVVFDLTSQLQAYQALLTHAQERDAERDAELLQAAMAAAEAAEVASVLQEAELSRVREAAEARVQHREAPDIVMQEEVVEEVMLPSQQVNMQAAPLPVQQVVVQGPAVVTQAPQMQQIIAAPAEPVYVQAPQMQQIIAPAAAPVWTQTMQMQQPQVIAGKASYEALERQLEESEKAREGALGELLVLRQGGALTRPLENCLLHSSSNGAEVPAASTLDMLQRRIEQLQKNTDRARLVAEAADAAEAAEAAEQKNAWHRAPPLPGGHEPGEHEFGLVS